MCPGQSPASTGGTSTLATKSDALDAADSPESSTSAYPICRVAADLRAHGWRLDRVLSDNGSEFRSQVFGDTVRELGAIQTFIQPGRPATNGAVERGQRTILEGCWRPSFARSLVPKLGGLLRDLAGYLDYNLQ